MQKVPFVLSAVAVVAVTCGFPAGRAAGPPQSGDGKPKYTIKQVMETINKGPDAIVRKVMKGQASKEEIARMVEFYASLPLNAPIQGDPASWKAEAASLLRAAEGIQQNDPKGLESLKKPGTCTACHKDDRPSRVLGVSRLEP